MRERVLVALGALGAITAALSFRTLIRPAGPGRLIADVPELEWRAPAPQQGRSPWQAAVRFSLTNRGGRPVRILSVESGCGCTKPIVRPEVVGPGEEAEVSVTALPPSIGERSVPIVLRTDSPVTRQVELRLKLKSSRRPPFLVTVAGDLTFAEGPPREAREIRAVTVESAGTPTPPRWTSDLAFLSVEPAGMEEVAYPEPGVVQRTYTYRVRFDGPPPPGTFSGQLAAVDPWDARHTEPIRVYGRTASLPRVVPPQLVLDPAAADERGLHAEFCVLLDAGAPELVVESDSGGEPSLVVEPIRRGRTERFRAFAVRLRPGAMLPGGRGRLLVKLSPADEGGVVVPVIAAAEGVIP